MLSVSDLDVSIGPVPVIRKASLDLAEGEMCGLIGRNGAGKTTLLRALMGAIPATGKVRFGELDLLALPPHRRVGCGIGYMPEDRPPGARLHRRAEYPVAELDHADRRGGATPAIDLLDHA